MNRTIDRPTIHSLGFDPATEVHDVEGRPHPLSRGEALRGARFPLDERNPRMFVPNNFWAKPGDYRKATQRVYHANHSTFIELPVVGSAKLPD